MSIKLYPPGTRKGNRHYVARGSVAGIVVERVCTDADGKPTADARAARRYARALERATLARADAERAGRAAAERDAAQARTPLTFADAAGRYIAARDPSANDRRYLARLTAEIGGLPLASIVQADLDDAALALYPDGTPATRNRQAYAPAAAVLHYAAANRWAPYWVVAKAAEPEPEAREPAAGTREILLAATAQRGMEREHLLLLALFCQGWRITETLGLTEDRVNLPHGEARFWIRKAGRKGRWKTIVLHSAFAQALRRTGPLSPAPDGDPGGGDSRYFPWRDRHAVYKWLRPLCEAQGVTFTPHMARHAFGGTLRREAGATPRDLVDTGSWTSEKSTARYARSNADHARRLLRAVDVGGQPKKRNRAKG